MERETAGLRRTVLHVGCGSYAPGKLHPLFRSGPWTEIRVDIDPLVRPDIVSSITDLSAVADAGMDAVWSSHNVEHLHGFEVVPAFREFRRVLKPGGFLVLTTPDLEGVARLIADGGLEATAYTAPAGDITPLDILFGHQASIRAGNGFMAHRTGFTAERLGRLLTEAGFAEAHVQHGDCLDLWAVAYATVPAEVAIDLPGRRNPPA